MTVERFEIYPEDGAPHGVERAVPGGLLSRDQILLLLGQGSIIIDPLVKENIGGASVDVTLGQWYFRENKAAAEGPFRGAINLWADEAATQLWTGPFRATTIKEVLTALWRGKLMPSLAGQNVALDDQVIVLGPGENILAHTTEFIGGNQSIDTAMQARSSMGRSHITVCRCAGWGDPGYINRWTMEITNNSVDHPVILVVGRRVAQIVFWEVAPVQEQYGAARSKYQDGIDLDTVKKNWRPEGMLPRLYLDREVRRLADRIGALTEVSRESTSGVHRAFPIPVLPFGEYSTPSPEAVWAYNNYMSLGWTPYNLTAMRGGVSKAGNLDELTFEAVPVE